MLDFPTPAPTSLLRALTFPNKSGETTVTWTEDQDERWEQLIADKMKKGVTFFIIDPRFDASAGTERPTLENPEDAKNYRALAIPDEDVAAFVGSGKGRYAKTPKSPARNSRVSKDPKEIAKSESVGVTQMQGG